MDTDVSHEVERRLTALEEFVGMNKEEESSEGEEETSEETPQEGEETEQ